MGVLLRNNATSRLASSLTAGATTLSVTSGDGSKFPSPTAGQWFPLTVIKASGVLEIMRCTARSGDVLTVVRAQEGTGAQAFTAGDRVELRITAAALAEFKQTDTISAFMQGMLDDANAAEARNTLGLGTAAIRNAQVSSTDDTANTLMAVGAFGLGANVPVVVAELQSAPLTVGTGFYVGEASQVGSPGGIGLNSWGVLSHRRTGNFATQMFELADDNRVFFRRYFAGAWRRWVELYHTGNISTAVMPVGAYYTQFAETNGTFASAKSPSTLFGGTWSLKFNTESMFFRTEGTLAAAGRSSGVQMDAFQGHWHDQWGAYSGGIGSAPTPGFTNNSTIKSNTNNSIRDPQSDQVNGEPRTAAETRPRNRLIRVWERTA